MNFFKRLWRKVREPRVISTLTSIAYLVGTIGGLSVMIEPPTTLEGAIGVTAMRLIAFSLTLGGLIGVPTSLFGVWWLERIAVLFVALATVLYASVVITLHLTEPGNRILQSAFLVVVFLSQIARWHRIHIRPYDPFLHV